MAIFRIVMPLRCGTGSPFGLPGLWDNWKNPSTGEWVRTFCIIRTAASELVGRSLYRRARVVTLSAREALCSSGEEQLLDFGTDAQWMQER
jgi:putative SOS response-associated peptidase YedK